MTFRTPMSADELRHELQLAINLALSCWARMHADERGMALRLARRFEDQEGYLDIDWRKERDKELDREMDE